MNRTVIAFAFGIVLMFAIDKWFLREEKFRLYAGTLPAWDNAPTGTQQRETVFRLDASNGQTVFLRYLPQSHEYVWTPIENTKSMWNER